MKGVSTVIATILMLIITIALAGMAYMYIAGVFTARTQGIEVVDAYCVEGTVDNATLVVRNIGTTTIDTDGITVSRTAPDQESLEADSATCDWEATPDECIMWDAASLAPGNTTVGKTQCTMSGGRSCHYRLVPPIGSTVTGTVYCT